MPNTIKKLIELMDDYTDLLSVRDIHKADFTEKVCRPPYCQRRNGAGVVPVTERLPEKGTRVVAYKGYTFLAKLVRNQWIDVEWNCYRYGVTHWLPMPQPPKGEG